MASVRFSLPRYTITEHALLRWVERCRPDLAFEDGDGRSRALLAMLAFVADARPEREWPVWLSHLAPHHHDHVHLTVGDDVVLPIGNRDGYTAIKTVLTREWDGRGGASERYSVVRVILLRVTRSERQDRCPYAPPSTTGCYPTR
jgi:hypothetical protein